MLKSSLEKTFRFLNRQPLLFSLTLHLLLFAILLILPQKVPKVEEHIQVQTVKLNAPKPPEKMLTRPLPKKAVKKTKATKKKPIKKAKPKKTPNPKVKPSKEKNSTSQKRPLSQKKSSASTQATKAPLFALPAKSQKSLLQILQRHLELPELGKVTLELTLSKKGKVINVKVVSSESKQNESYLLKALNKIIFSELNLKSETTLIVEFGNERPAEEPSPESC